MSDEFEVDVPVQCDRTKKTHNLRMTLEDAATFKKSIQEKKETATEIVSFLKGIPHPQPDLVVMFRGTVIVLPTVVDKKDGAVLRLLNTLTQDDAAFPAPPVTKRKKSAKNGKRDGATLEEASAPADAE